MKKFLFLSLAAAAVLSSCESGDSSAPDFDSELVPIQLGVSNTVLETRGTGTVGDTSATANVWKGQSFYVYMLCKDNDGLDSMAIAQFSGADIYNNRQFFAPNGSAMSSATPADGATNYYPSTRNFNFYAYRLDGANTIAPDFDANKDSLSVPFTIDGSQDIMVAKAYLTTVNGEKQSDKIYIGSTSTQKKANAKRYYSAFSARHGVQPVFTFRHLLTRLQFQIVPCRAGATDPTNGIVIDSIKVVSTKKSGTLTIAGKDDNTTGTVRQKIWWSESDAKRNDFWLKQRQAADTDKNMDLEKLASIDLKGQPYYSTEAATDGRQTEDWTAAAINVGEAILLAPEASYEVHVIGHVDLVGKPAHKFDFKDTIKKSFVAGTSYSIVVSIYGYEKMEMVANLTPWMKGATISLQPEETYVDGFATE